MNKRQKKKRLKRLLCKYNITLPINYVVTNVEIRGNELHVDAKVAVVRPIESFIIVPKIKHSSEI